MVLTHWMTWHIVPRKSESQPNQVTKPDLPGLRQSGTNHRKLVFNTTGAGMSRRPLLIYGTTSAVSVLILMVSYFPFYWLLVQIQSWRLGHPNPFTIRPAVDAIPCAFAAALITFWFTVRGARSASLLRLAMSQKVDRAMVTILSQPAKPWSQSQLAMGTEK